MRTRIVSILLAATALSVLMGCRPTPTASNAVACVDFEAPLMVGTKYGTPTHNPGDVIFTSNNIPVTVHDFKFTGTGGTFNLASIDLATAVFGSGQMMRSNNINLGFDFSGLAFNAMTVRFDFLDLGGSENISVNGSPIFAGELTAAPGSIGGVTFAVSSTPVAGGKRGTVTLTGAVKDLRIGGQEFWIDNLCASNCICK
jgi:hypothetical protein